MQDIFIPMTIILGVIGYPWRHRLARRRISRLSGLRKDSQVGLFGPSGIIGLVIGAVIVLLIWMTVVGGRRTIRGRYL
jgi:hypothetical protein